jgi:hypothetical protein
MEARGGIEPPVFSFEGLNRPSVGPLFLVVVVIQFMDICQRAR